jgi:hypothetical protein
MEQLVAPLVLVALAYLLLLLELQLFTLAAVVVLDQAQVSPMAVMEAVELEMNQIMLELLEQRIQVVAVAVVLVVAVPAQRVVQEALVL